MTEQALEPFVLSVECIRAAKVLLLRWSSSSDPFCSDLFGAHLHTPVAAELA